MMPTEPELEVDGLPAPLLGPLLLGFPVPVAVLCPVLEDPAGGTATQGHRIRKGGHGMQKCTKPAYRRRLRTLARTIRPARGNPQGSCFALARMMQPCTR